MRRQADEFFRAVLRANPEDLDAALWLGEQAWQNNDLPQAKKLFDAVVRSKKAQAFKAHWKLSQIARKQKDSKAEIHHAEAALAGGLREPGALMVMVEAWRKQGGSEAEKKAIEALREVLALRPNDVSAAARLGELLFKRKQHSEAIAVLKPFHGRKASTSAHAKVAYLLGRISQSKFEASLPPNSAMALELPEGAGKAMQRNHQEALDYYAAAYRQGDRSSPTMIARARQFRAQKRTPQAKATLAQLLKTNPGDAEGNFLLGQILFEAKSKSADAYLQRAGGVGYQKGRTLAMRGLLKFRARNYEETIPLLQGAIEGGRASTEVRSALGQALYLSKKSTEAEPQLKAASDADDATASFFLARILMEREAFALAKPRLQKALGKSPDEAWVHYALGKVIHTEGNSVEALGHLRSALKTNGKLGEAHALVGAIHAASGKHNKAIGPLTQALRFNPQDVNSAVLLAMAYFKTGKASQARQVLSKLSASGKVDATLLALARESRETKQYKNSNDFIGLIREKKAEAISLQGQNLVNLGRDADAHRTLLKALELNPKDAGAYTGLGQLEERKKQPKKAAEYYRKALDLDPSSGFSVERLASILLGGNDYQAARDVAVAYADANPKAATAQFVVARSLEGLRDFPKARQYYERTLKVEPEHPGALLHLGRLLYDDGKLKDSSHLLSQVYALLPKDGSVCEARARLASAQRDFTTASNAYACALKIKPKNTEYRLGLAEAQAALNRKDSARQVLLDVGREAPELAEVHLRLAKLQPSTRSAEESLSQYVHLSAFERSDSDYARHEQLRYRPLSSGLRDTGAVDNSAGGVLIRMGVAQAKRGRWLQASQSFERAVGVASANVTALLNLGVSHLRLGNIGRAGEVLELAAELSSGDDAITTNRIAVYLRQQELKEARALLSELKNQKSSVAVMANVAIVHAALGKFTQAQGGLSNALKAAKSKEEKALVSLNLGALFLEMGDRKAARQHLASALSLHAELPMAQFLLAQVDIQEERTDSAIQRLRSAIMQQPVFASARMSLARLYGQQGALYLASAQLEEVTRLDPHGVAYAQLGAIYGKQGRYRDEERAMRKASEMAQKEKNARLARTMESKSIGISRFKNASGNAEYAWLEVGIAEALTTDLMNLSVLRVVEQSQLNKMIEQMALAQSGIIEDSNLPDLSKYVQADYLVVGSFQIQGKKIRLDGRLVNIQDGTVAKTGSASGNMDDLFTLERKLALELVTNAVSLSEADKRRLMQANATSLDNLRTIAQGRLLAFAGNRDLAKEAFRKAMQDDPAYGAALDEIQQAWQDTAAAMAIMPFTDGTQDPEYAWLSRGIAESLTSDLKKITGIYLVERLAIDKAVEEHAFAQQVGNEAEIGKLVGASILLLGSYQVFKGKVVLNARLVDAAEGQVLMASKVSGKLDDIFEVNSKLAQDIANALNVEVTEEEKAMLAQGQPSVEDFKRYIRSQQQVVVDKGEKLRLTMGGFKALAESRGGVESELSDYLQSAFRVSERTSLVTPSAALQDAVSAGSMENAEAAAEALKEAAGADGVVAGTYAATPDGQVRVDVRVLRVEDGSVWASAGGMSSQQDLEVLRRELVADLFAGLGVPLPNQLDLGDSATAASRPLFWSKLALGISAGAGIGAGLLLLKTNDARVQSQEAFDRYEVALDPVIRDQQFARAKSKQSTADTLERVSYVLGGVAVASLGYALWEIFTYRDEGKTSVQAGAETGVNVTVLPGGAALQLQTDF